MPRGVSPVDEARLQGRLWTPALFGGRLLGWYDASVSASFTLSGSAVTEWRDQSGNGNHLQSSGVNAPLLGTFAGRPSVNFDGVNDYLLTVNTTPQKTAIFAIHGYPTNSAVPPFAWSSWASGGESVQEVHLQSNGSIRAINFDSDTYADTPTGTPQSFFDDCIMGGAYGPAADPELRGHLNGRSASVNRSPASATLYRKVFGVRKTATTFPSQSRFSEIIMISGWSLADLRKIEGYLAHRWGGFPLSRLIADHPFKNRPPLIGD